MNDKNKKWTRESANSCVHYSNILEDTTNSCEATTDSNDRINKKTLSKFYEKTYVPARPFMPSLNFRPAQDLADANDKNGKHNPIIKFRNEDYTEKDNLNMSKDVGNDTLFDSDLLRVEKNCSNLSIQDGHASNPKSKSKHFGEFCVSYFLAFTCTSVLCVKCEDMSLFRSLYL